MLVAGTPGSGKSNLLNVMLCSFIRFNSPHRLKIALIDMKGGMEFGPYSEIPHLLRYRPATWEGDEDERPVDETESLILNDEQDEEGSDMQPALVERMRDVVPLLKSVYAEGRRRASILRKAGERNLGNFNWKHPKRALPHIVLIIDELAEFRQLPSKDYARTMKLLESIAQLFRAVGIHLVLATQTPTKEVIPLTIRNAIPGRVAYSCPNATASALIIGDGRAAGLSPAGRCVLDWNGRQVEMQSPLIPDRVIASVIEGAIRGEYEEYEIKRHDVTEEEIFKIALEEFAGGLPADYLYRWFANKQRHIPRSEVRDIIGRYLGQEVMVGSTVYRVEKGAGGKPPHLVTVEDSSTRFASGQERSE